MEQEKIRQNLEKYIEVAKNKNLSVQEIINNFGKIFNKELIYFNKNAEPAYREINNYQFYIKDSYGISLTVINSHSPEDITVSLSSHFARDEYIRNGITIFDEGIVVENIKDVDLNKFFDIDLSLESIKQNFSSDVLKTFPKGTLQDEKYIFDLMINEAIQEHRKLKEYVDDELKSVEHILFNNINKLKDDKLFFSKEMYFFNIAYPEFLDKQIEDYKQALYIIENKNTYRNMLINETNIMEYESDIYYVVSDITNLFNEHGIIYQQNNYGINDEIFANNGKSQIIENILKDIKQKIENLESDLKKLNDEVKQLLEKKYSLTDIASGQKRKDMLYLEQLGWVENNTLEGEGKIAKVSFKIMDYKDIYEEIYKRYDLLRNDFQVMTRMKNKEFNLKYPFKNYTIWPKLYKGNTDYINDEFTALASLDTLVNRKDEYIIKFNELKKIKADIDKLNKKKDNLKTFDLKKNKDLYSKELNYGNEIEHKNKSHIVKM